MTSIIISSDDHVVCQEIGQETAAALGYTYIGRELLAQVAAQHKVPEEKLVRVLDGPTRRMTSKTRDLLLSCIQTTTLNGMLEDSVVCAGLGAHLYVRDVSHVMLIRVLSDAKARISALMAQRQVSLRKAQKVLERENARLSSWSADAFAQSEGDPALYDIVISLGQIEVGKVVDILKDMSGYRKFRPMTYSRRCLSDLALASSVRTALLAQFPEIRVRADGDKAIVHVKCSKRQKQRTVEAIKEVARGTAGVNLVEVHAVSNMRMLDQQAVAGQ